MSEIAAIPSPSGMSTHYPGKVGVFCIPQADALDKHTLTPFGRRHTR